MTSFTANIHIIARPVVRYFKLRPAFFWSLFSLVVLLIFLIAVRFDSDYTLNRYTDISRFEMVEFVLEAVDEPEAEIEISDEAASEEQEVLEFGETSGNYGQMSQGATPPRPIYQSKPAYPRSMRSAGIEGVVVLELGIDENGTVVYGRVARSLGREFDKAAIEWVQSLRFYPAIDSDGRPFALRIHLPINFKLDN